MIIRPRPLDYARLPAVVLPLLLLLLLGVRPVGAQFSDRVVERAKSSSVQILILGARGSIQGNGSGFFISDQGHVATNFHVVEGASAVVVTFARGDRVFHHPGEVVAGSKERDLAILKTRKFPGSRVATLAVAPPSSAQRVMSIGFPGALQLPSTSSGLQEVAQGELRGSPGAVSSFVPATFSGEVGRFQQESEMAFADGHVVRADLILHSAKTSGGNSGGPLIDIEGRAAGVIFAHGSDDSGRVDYALAIHSGHLVELARAHRVPITVSTARASVPRSGSPFLIPLLLSVAGLAIASFLMALKKPRAAIIDGLSRLTVRGGAREPDPRHQVSPPMRNPPPRAAARAVRPSGERRMVLRGRGPDGRSFHLEFDADRFRRNGGRLVLGRKLELCQLHIPQDSVSGQHALISLQGGELMIADRNSGNGTFVNDREVPLGAPPVPLRPGDRLRVGEVELVYDVFS